jgi:hypothetical protein
MPREHSSTARDPHAWPDVRLPDLFIQQQCTSTQLPTTPATTPVPAAATTTATTPLSAATTEAAVPGQFAASNLGVKQPSLLHASPVFSTGQTLPYLIMQSMSIFWGQI